MANVRISQLPTAPSAITGAELVPIVQNGQTVHATISQLVSSPSQTQTFLTLNNEPTLPNSRYLTVGTGLGLTDTGPQGTYQITLNATAGSLEASGLGIIAKTASGTVAPRTISITGAGLSITNGNGVSGNPTLTTTGFLYSLANYSATGILTSTGSALTPVTIGAGLNYTGTTLSSTTLGTVTSVGSGTGLTGGPITTSGSLSIANTGVTSGVYGNASTIPVITVNAQGQITSVSSQAINAPSYQGTWNANTNIPALVSSIGTQGFYYVVSAAGNTNLNGVTGWNIGDWAIFSGGVWEKIPGSSTESFTNLITTNLQVGGLTGYMYANNTTGNVTASTTIPTTALSGTITNAQLANSTISGVALGGNLLTLTLGTGLSGTSYNGASSVTAAIANTAVTAGSYGSSTQAGTFTVNAQGQLTLAANVTITPAVGSITGLGTGVATALGLAVNGSGSISLSNSPVFVTPALGTPSSGVLTNTTGLPLTTGVTGILPIANGGTNSSATPTNGGIGYGTGTAYAYSLAGTNGQFLQSTGANPPAWATISTTATTIGIASNSSNASYFPLFYTAATAASATTAYTASNYSFNPSTGTLSVTALLENSYAIVSQKDIGTSPNQVPLNQYLGTMAYEDKAAVILTGDANINGLTVGRGAGNVSSNTAIGYQAGLSNTTGSASTFVGYQVGYTNTSGGGNSAFGAQALLLNSTGNFNTAIGNGALYANSTGGGNNAIGSSDLSIGSALFRNTTGNNNSAFGNGALGSNLTGSDNVAIGNQALQLNTASGQNTAVGRSALLNTTGAYNTALGFQSGYGITSGGKNVILGSYQGSAAPISATGSNYVVLSDGDGNVRQTWNSSGALGIGSTPSYGTSGQVLTSQGSAAAPTWTTVSSGSGTVTSVGGTGTVNGLTLSGTVTTSGNLTLGGTLDLSTPPAIGATTPSTGKFTTLAATGVLTASAGTASLPSIVTSSGSTTGLYSSTANVLGVSISGSSIGTFTSSGLNGMAIGQTTAAGGSFTFFSATSNSANSVTAATGGKTSVTAVTGSLTLTTGGNSLASTSMSTGFTWRIRAYGTYTASSSANVRSFTVAPFWGSTQLTSITAPAAVLSLTAQTTPWEVEFTITGSSATAAWVTGIMHQNTGTAAGVALLTTVATAASTTGLTTTSALDFRVGQTGTATSGDTINVHSVILERIA